MLQEECFRYYWEGRTPTRHDALKIFPGTTASYTRRERFGIMAVIVGVDRGLSPTSRPRAAHEDHNFSKECARYHGVWSTLWMGPPVRAAGLRYVDDAAILSKLRF